jgi:hypothetical protein
MTCNCQHEEVCIKLHQAKMAELFGRRLDIDGTKCPHRLPKVEHHLAQCPYEKTIFCPFITQDGKCDYKGKCHNKIKNNPSTGAEI